MKLLCIFFVSLLGTVCADDKEKSIIGTWVYTSIESRGKPLPIHKGDKVVFSQDLIKWRWTSRDFEHKIKETKFKDFRAFVAHELDGSPYCKGIFKIEGDTLIICDRSFKLGYPSEFSSKNATLIRLRRVVDK